MRKKGVVLLTRCSFISHFNFISNKYLTSKSPVENDALLHYMTTLMSYMFR
jgi:hypothetical protein